ncbi:MAG TPA: diaminopimelate decarboxylase [Nitriliruptorales bacterium]|nr:diaminopimelate decarboxylase [Nitriliruptorales bacterium]
MDLGVDGEAGRPDGPWPITATRDRAGVLHVGGVSVPELARAHGTPLWVVDEEDLRTRCRTYREAFAGAEVAYASKAWCTVGVLQLVADEGLWVDVASGGELHTAHVAGVPMERVVLHGNNKSEAELRRAIELGVGRIVVDSMVELERLETLGRQLGCVATCWLRITPGIDAHTHDYVRTGHDDTKFGFGIRFGHHLEAFAYAADLPHVELVGAHAHIGSQVFGWDPFVANAEAMVGVLARWRDRFGVALGELNLGGGMGIRYTHEDPPVHVDRLARTIADAVDAACVAHSLPSPRLWVEPGRAIVGPSTLTVYQVGTIKELPGVRTYVSVDGGMSDNIRPALYQAEHEVELASRTGSGQMAAFSVVGKHCESGDLVRERASLPADLSVGDLLAVAATGAYTESMASNYNRLPRPAAVLVRDGRVRPLLRRETDDDLVARDIALD